MRAGFNHSFGTPGIWDQHGDCQSGNYPRERDDLSRRTEQPNWECSCSMVAELR